MIEGVKLFDTNFEVGRTSKTLGCGIGRIGGRGRVTQSAHLEGLHTRLRNPYVVSSTVEEYLFHCVLKNTS